MGIAPVEKMGLALPGAVNFGPRDTRGLSPNLSVHGDESDTEGNQAELSATATKRITW